MKAEHRRELHTNALAEGMGRLVQRLKTKPQKSSVWLWLLLIAAAVVVVVFLFLRSSWARQGAQLWADVDQPSATAIDNIKANYPNTNQGYAVRFQYAWVFLWDLGIKRMAANPTLGKEGLQAAQREYQRLYDEVKDTFPTLAAEARYGIAVAQETLTIENPDNLNKAISAYMEVVKDYPDTAHGKQAKERLELLEKEGSRKDIVDFYSQLRRDIGGNLPAGHPIFDQPPQKEEAPKANGK